MAEKNGMQILIKLIFLQVVLDGKISQMFNVVDLSAQSYKAGGVHHKRPVEACDARFL